MSTQYQSGYKLRDIRRFLISTLGKRIAQRMDCEMSGVSLNLTSKHMGQGAVLMYQRYVAEFLFDKFPHRECSPAVLFANIGAWLMDNDASREDIEDLGDPEIEVVIEDERNAEVLITIEFEEPVNVIEDKDGPVYWQGKRWRIEEYEIYVASAFKLAIKNGD